MSVSTRESHGSPSRRMRVPTQVGNLQRARRRSAPRAGRSIRSMALAVDVVTVGTALVVAAVVRASLLPANGSADYVPRLETAAPLLGAGWLVAIWLLGGYQSAVFGVGADEYKRVFNAGFVTAAVIGVGCYLARFQLSRGFFVLALLLGTVLVLCGRIGLRSAVRASRRKGSLLHRVLIVGTPTQVDDVAQVLSRESWLGYDVVGALTPGIGPSAVTAAGVPVLGPTTSVVRTAAEIRADIVVLAGGAVDSAVEMRKIAWELEGSSTQVVVAPSVTDVSRERISVRPVGGLPLLHLEKPRSAAAVRRAKRLFDVTGALLLLLLFSPLFLVAAVQVWCCDRGPILFRQERIGRDGRPFDCLKIRTMVLDAEARLDALHQQTGLEGGAFAKIKRDPRVTRPGRWLRRYSVDELPQLFNVLRGDMSLVGPRPQVAREVARYDSAMSRRLRVRPGMTGLWQVSGRSDLSLSEAMRLDLYYVDNWSMVQDLIILAKTFSAVVGSRGAY
jgi:exopolysaccharide biosynthesis polyprenyl glycosylphosphotransferase